MKFTVTPVRCSEADVGVAASATVDYLTGQTPDLARNPVVGSLGEAMSASGPTTGSYYEADQLEGAGWWSGRGADALDLAGDVDPRTLESLLTGRHHQTGHRIVGASGSSGRSNLKVGQHTRVINGTPVWDVTDAAAHYDANIELAAELANDLQASLFVRDDEGTYWLTAAGIDELGTRLRTRVDLQVDEALADGPVNELLTVGECAQLTGLSEQRLRKVIKEWVGHRDKIEAAERGEGLPHQRAWLPATKAKGKWHVARGDLEAFCHRRKPPAVVLAYDVTATCEKSVSLMAMLGGEDYRGTVLDCLKNANTSGMDWLDRHASRGRRKGSSVGSEGFTIASFMHATSRALDPHTHIHNLVLNFLRDPFGGHRTIDGRFLFTEAKTASALATAQLRWELSRALPGSRWNIARATPGAAEGLPGPHDVWELAGMSGELIDEFSNRRADIEAAAELFRTRFNRLPTRAELQEISQQTRQSKQVVEAAALLVDWADRAEHHGFDPEDVAHAGPTYRPMLTAELSDRERADLFDFLAENEYGVCAEESTFSFGDLIAAVNRWTYIDPTIADQAKARQPRVMPAATVLEVANEFLATHLALQVEHGGQLIRRADGRTTGTVVQEQRWTTPQIVMIQSDIVNWWGRGVAAGVLSEATDAQIGEIATSYGLGVEQKELLEAWTSLGDQYQAAVGRPGTGKTFTMRAAKQLWEQAGYKVLGAAVKGDAAQHLGRETGISSETVAYYLAAADTGRQLLDANTVLVVDEATTLSDRDLHRLMKMCRSSGAALRMIGDPKQQQSVAAGGMWEQMVDLYRTRTPELRTQHRLQDPTEITVADQLRKGQIDEAFNALLASGRIQQAESPDEAELLALRGWLDRHDRGVIAPMIDRRNGARRRLNMIAQAIRVLDGEVQTPVDYGDRRFGVGDRVVSRRPNRDLFAAANPANYMSNGSSGTVVAATDEAVVVDFDGLGEITIPPAIVRSDLELGYALTAYSVQGLTFDESEATIQPGELLNSLYVVATRGRNANTLIATRAMPGEAHISVAANDPDTPPVVDVVDTLKTTHLDPAIIADPDLEALLRRSHGTLAGAGRPQDRIECRALDAECDRFARLTLTHPPAEFTGRFPERPDHVPWLAHRWNAALATVASYRYRWAQPATPGHLVGPEPDRDSNQHRDWADTCQATTSAAMSIITHLLSDHLQQDFRTDADLDLTVTALSSELAVPLTVTRWPWLTDRLHQAILAGHITPTTDYRRLAAWVNETQQRITTAGVDDKQVTVDHDLESKWDQIIADGKRDALQRSRSDILAAS